MRSVAFISRPDVLFSDLQTMIAWSAYPRILRPPGEEEEEQWRVRDVGKTADGILVNMMDQSSVVCINPLLLLL